MGYQRGGLYSYDWLDRLFGYLDGPSSNRILPEFQHLAVGDEIPIGRGGGFPVTAIEPYRALVLGGKGEGFQWVWQFGLYPLDENRTRLVSRNSVRVPRTLGSWLLMRAIEPSDCGAGFSASAGEIPQVPRSDRFEVSEMRGFRASRLSFRLAQLLPLEVASINVFRAALVSVVLTLAIGPNAGLLCTVWCHDDTSMGCPHHESTTSASVRADDTCTNVVGRGGRVCSRGRSAHGSRLRRPERSRCSSVPTCRPTN